MIPFIDLETTGLAYTGPVPDLVLEVGIVITDEHYKPAIMKSWLCNPPYPAWEGRLTEVVQEMHTKSGLLQRLADGHGMPYEKVEQEAIEFLMTHEATGKPMYGNTVHFDRGMLLNWMPTLADTFHYRNVDISSIKEWFRAQWPDHSYPPSNPEDKKHRAIDDLMESIKELAYYTDILDRHL